MAEMKKEQTAAETGAEFEQISGLLDVHAQSSPASRGVKTGEQWSPLRTIAFLVGQSSILWALTISLVYYLFW